MVYDNNNIFARILRRELPAEIIFENDSCLAFMDVMPQNDGHVLVLPKASAVDITDISSDILFELFSTVRLLAPRIALAMGKSGFQLRQYNGASAGQTVFHLHIHIIPMSSGDRLIGHGASIAAASILAVHAARIRTELDKLR